MTRPYNRHEPDPVVITEAVEPEPITYRFGTCITILTGFYAWLYRGMIWMYGEDEARTRFWYLFHKENSVSTPENAVPSL